MAKKVEKLKRYYVQWLVSCEGQILRFDTRKSAVYFMTMARGAGLKSDWTFGLGEKK